MRVVMALTAWLLALLGGSLHYLIAGVAMIASGHGALGTRYGDYTIAFALPRS